MDEDFSIRNEVESISPSYQDAKTTDYQQPDNSAFYEKFVQNVPLVTNSGYNANQPVGVDPYLVIENQQKLLVEQLNFQRSMLYKFTQQQNFWKCLFLVGLGVAGGLLALHLFKLLVRQNPTSKRKKSHPTDLNNGERSKDGR